MNVSIRLITTIIIISGFFNLGFSQAESEITSDELKQHIGYLASDDLRGRLPGTKGGLLAAEYIAGEYRKAGMELLADDGFQYFDVVTSVEAGEGIFLRNHDLDAELYVDFIPISFSKSGQLSAGVAFAGYGFQLENDSLRWDDYADLDVDGKWVIILRGEPDVEHSSNPFSSHAGIRAKVLTAKDNGAGGVLFVSATGFDEEDQLMRMFYDKTTADAGVPVLHIKRYIADSLLAASSYTIASLEDIIVDNTSSFSFESEVVLDGSSEVIHQKVQTQNVVGMIKGSDAVLKDEIIVIGGHYDHLGMGGRGSGSREPDTYAVHNGADDNASGVAGIIELAEKLSAGNNELKRSIVFVAFGAEEMGLLGSKYFVNNPIIDLDKVVAMFNFDMIGRLNDKNSIAIGGTGTSVEGEDLLNKYLDEYGMKGSFSREGFGPSDHASFYAEDITVFFISTGAHQDYHTPQDDIEFINFEGEKNVLDFSYELIVDVANRAERLTYQEAGSKSRKQGFRFKVTLGIVPDFTSSENDGLGVGGVSNGGPADKAGMLKGDVIVAMDGMEVASIYDYMARLKKFKAGQIITVDVIRDGKKVVLLVQL
ncbi:MAG: M20/M25/M40 family metallo-hydrolase [Bacteroidetes bacterium]|nr:M20/M25/M40 family metallo-hydrolase [Bacteroidota bacterium]